MRRARQHGLLVAAALLLAGCSTGAGAGAPTWKPQPSFQGEGGGRIIPAPQAPGPAGPGGPGGGPVTPASPQPSASGSATVDPAVVASGLTAPVGLTVLPDNTALVGERTTGRIVQVQPRPGQPVKNVRTLGGLDTHGDGGLLDLALSPNYVQDSLIYAYVTTAADNRVIAFTLAGPATPVLTGIPKGAAGNAGRITFAGDGTLYVGTGDTGRPALAPSPASLAGKVLRVTDIGRPAADNPAPSSPVYTRGHRNPAGLCEVPKKDLMLEVEGPGADGLFDVNVLQADGDYGWPAVTQTSQGPIATLPAGRGSPGGCAVLDGVLYVTSLDGREVLSAPLVTKNGAVSVGPFGSLLKGKYGRLRTVVADSSGALWLTTSNRDGHGRPVAADERVIRIVPAGGGAGNVPL